MKSARMINDALSVPIALGDGNEDLGLPRYATKEAAGLDLRAAIVQPVTIQPRASHLIPCGFRIAVPCGYVAQVLPRSGLAAKHGVTVLNSPGTIDPDYRGEVRVVLINFGHVDFRINRGDRIAQLILIPAPRVEWSASRVLSSTERDEGGFGSTDREETP